MLFNINLYASRVEHELIFKLFCITFSFVTDDADDNGYDCYARDAKFVMTYTLPDNQQ